MPAQRPKHQTATLESRMRNADASAKAKTPNGDAANTTSTSKKLPQAKKLTAISKRL
jgi:hypothetical protein